LRPPAPRGLLGIVIRTIQFSGAPGANTHPQMMTLPPAPMWPMPSVQLVPSAASWSEDVGHAYRLVLARRRAGEREDSWAVQDAPELGQRARGAVPGGVARAAPGVAGLQCLVKPHSPGHRSRWIRLSWWIGVPIRATGVARMHRRSRINHGNYGLPVSGVRRWVYAAVTAHSSGSVARF
jgi:hypothetical protein